VIPVQNTGDTSMLTFPNAERALTAVGGLALFALNEVRMFHSLPRIPDPGNGQTHPAFIQVMDAAAPLYLSLVDLTVRWGLVALVVGLCLWALAETFEKQPQTAERP
jgi:hypothetical protein